MIDMRKIERDMLKAIELRCNWRSGNTEVIQYARFCNALPCYTAEVVLHGSVIATVDYYSGGDNVVTPARATFQRWPTRTTVSRLRALGVDARVRQGIPYIGGSPA